MMRKSDPPEVRRLALMRRADTEAGSPHNIGGVRKKPQRPKPSLPKMPWDDDDHARKHGESTYGLVRRGN